MAVVSSQKHNVTIGKKSSWEIAYLCKVDDKVVGNNFKGSPSKCKVLPGRRMIEVEHYQNTTLNRLRVNIKHFLGPILGAEVAQKCAPFPAVVTITEMGNANICILCDAVKKV